MQKKKRGYAFNEFLSPYTGLCSECSREQQARHDAARYVKELRNEAHEARRDTGMWIVVGSTLFVTLLVMLCCVLNAMSDKLNDQQRQIEALELQIKTLQFQR